MKVFPIKIDEAGIETYPPKCELAECGLSEAEYPVALETLKTEGAYTVEGEYFGIADCFSPGLILISAS